MRAAKLKRRPPLTTFDTRLTRMVRSSYCSSVISSELQTLGPGSIGECRHPSVIGEPPAVEDHGGDVLARTEDGQARTGGAARHLAADPLVPAEPELELVIGCGSHYFAAFPA